MASCCTTTGGIVCGRDRRPPSVRAVCPPRRYRRTSADRAQRRAQDRRQAARERTSSGSRCGVRGPWSRSERRRLRSHLQADRRHVSRLRAHHSGAAGNTSTVDRAELLRALDRLAAVVDPGAKAMRSWSDSVGARRAGPAPVLPTRTRRCRGCHRRDDRRQRAGSRLRTQLAEMSTELSGKWARIDIVVAATEPHPRHRSRTTATLISLQMPCVWPARSRSKRHDEAGTP